RASAARSFRTPPRHSSGSPSNEVANTSRSGSSLMIPEPSPLEARNSAPFLLRDSAPPVFTSSYMISARPVSGSSRITLLASLFAKSNVPSSPAMRPSALLPSHDHTTFHSCPAAMTPGISVDGSDVGGGGGDAFAALPPPPPPSENGCGRVLHWSSTAGSPGSCQACKLLPRSKAEDGLCADAAEAAQPSSTAKAIPVLMIIPVRRRRAHTVPRPSRAEAARKAGHPAARTPYFGRKAAKLW